MTEFDLLLAFLDPESQDSNHVSARVVFSRRQTTRYLNALKLREKFVISLFENRHQESSSTRLIDRITALFQLTRADDLNKSDIISYRKRIESTLGELLDYCDERAQENSETVLYYALDYQQNGRAWRTYRMLRRYLELQPDDCVVTTKLAELYRENGSISRALETFQRALELQPDSGSLNHDYGLTLLHKLDYKRAIRYLDTACTIDKTNNQFSANLARARNLCHWHACAEQDDQMPGIELDDTELDNECFHPETLALAVYFYRKYGTLLIKNAFDPDIITDCRDQYLDEYREYFVNEKKSDALQIGDRRFQVTLALKGAFNQPGLYANPFVLELMKQLIDEQVIIGSTVCATSLPGSKDQHLHKDHRALFTRGVDDDPVELPPVAITTMIPLVYLDEKIGTTQVKKGSHRLSRSESAKLPTQTPIAPVGSCFFMDFALSHKGQGNRTERIRPILNMVYHQHWFTDNKNFRIQPPLRLQPAEYEKIPERYQSLFNWTQQPGVDQSVSH